MTEKYIDLAPLIASMHDQPLGTMRVVLGLLDEFASEHPDQVPGRTITAGEVGRRSHLINGRYIETPSIIDFLEALGITVVPDAEPTNAEKLEQLLWSINKEHEGECLEGEAAVRAWAEALDEAGVKAPGGDE